MVLTDYIKDETKASSGVSIKLSYCELDSLLKMCRSADRTTLDNVVFADLLSIVDVLDRIFL